MNYQDKAAEMIEEIKSVFSRMDYSDLDLLVSEIIKANKVILIGVGREGLSTKAFCMRLMHLGIESHWVWDETTPAIEAGDLLIATSGCGKIGHIHYVVEKAKKEGAKVAVVTGDPEQKTARLADELIFLPAAVYLGTADVVPSEQLMGNLFEQSLLIMYDLVIAKLKDELKISREAMEARHRNLE